jgi:hypothetical protein
MVVTDEAEADKRTRSLGHPYNSLYPQIRKH